MHGGFYRAWQTIAAGQVYGPWHRLAVSDWLSACSKITVPPLVVNGDQLAQYQIRLELLRPPLTEIVLLEGS